MADLEMVFEVEGISCAHCASSIEGAVTALEGVNNVKVDVPARKVAVRYTPGLVTVQHIRETIENQGYEVK